MARLGRAVFEVTGALRINCALFGNVEPALHAHMFPRYVDEPEALRTATPWGYDWSAAPRFEARRVQCCWLRYGRCARDRRPACA